jgi:hypothetical protein
MVTESQKQGKDRVFTTYKFEEGDHGEILSNKVTYTNGPYPKPQLHIRDAKDNNKKYVTLNSTQERDAKRFEADNMDLTGRKFTIIADFFKPTKPNPKNPSMNPVKLLKMRITRTEDEWKALKERKSQRLAAEAAVVSDEAGLFASPAPKGFPADVEAVIVKMVAHKEIFLAKYMDTVAINGKTVPQKFIGAFRTTKDVTSPLTDDQITAVWQEIKNRIAGVTFAIDENII